MKFETSILNSMNQILNSREHASLFKKAYTQDSDDAWADDEKSSASSSGKSSVNYLKDKKHNCKSCGRNADNCMCGDGNMAKDNCHQCHQDADNCMCGDKMYAKDSSSEYSDTDDERTEEDTHEESSESSESSEITVNFSFGVS